MAVARKSAQFECSFEVDVNSVAFLSEMAALVPGIIYVFNHQTMSNEYSNRSIAQMLGYSPEEIQAMGEELLPTIVHPDDFGRLAEHVLSLQSLGEGEQAAWEYRALTRQGEEVWLKSIETVFSRAADGGVLRHIGIAFDITAQKTAELRLLKLNADLEKRVRSRTLELEALNGELEQNVEARTSELCKTNNELEQLSYIATHDLKAPINNMSSLIHMLEDAQDTLPPEHQETLGWMRMACDQATRKLDALVCVAQANAMPESPFEEVNLVEVTEQVQLNLCYQIKQTKAVIKTDFSQPNVLFLRQEMESMLQALVSNALNYKAPDRRPHIEISSHLEGDMTIVRVSDNGTGLDLPRDREKVFGLFQRAHVEPEGAGVALHTIQCIMRRIGGSIEVDGVAGKGCRFTLKFPRKSAV